ncbi:MAG: hypothetical protein KatS3mg027_2698 [Bacteroidia bacterium]|nr:MAG: hypothetical protein KatS3mg027_2698 [Bacteroidia bacterium]
MGNKKLGGIIIFLLMAFAFLMLYEQYLGRFVWRNEKSKATMRIVARVGNLEITDKDVESKIRIEEAYSGKRIEPAIALIQLLNDAVEMEVVAKYGVAPTVEEIKTLEEHADKTSKAPKILVKVKAIFGNDISAYRRLYIAPKIVNWKLRGFFSRNSELHRDERRAIEEVYLLVSRGVSFSEAVSRYNRLSAFAINENKPKMEYLQTTIAWPPDAESYGAEALKKFGLDVRPAEDPLVSILKTLSKNEIYSNIVEDDYSYKIIRLLERHSGKSGDEWKVEMIEVRKRPFEEWLEKEAERLNIVITDESLKKEIISRGFKYVVDN